MDTGSATRREHPMTLSLQVPKPRPSRRRGASGRTRPGVRSPISCSSMPGVRGPRADRGREEIHESRPTGPAPLAAPDLARSRPVRLRRQRPRGGGGRCDRASRRLPRDLVHARAVLEARRQVLRRAGHLHVQPQPAGRVFAGGGQDLLHLRRHDQGRATPADHGVVLRSQDRPGAPPDDRPRQAGRGRSARQRQHQPRRQRARLDLHQRPRQEHAPGSSTAARSRSASRPSSASPKRR